MSRPRWRGAGGRPDDPVLRVDLRQLIASARCRKRLTTGRAAQPEGVPEMFPPGRSSSGSSRCGSRSSCPAAQNLGPSPSISKWQNFWGSEVLGQEPVPRNERGSREDAFILAEPDGTDATLPQLRRAGIFRRSHGDSRTSLKISS